MKSGGHMACSGNVMGQVSTHSRERIRPETKNIMNYHSFSNYHAFSIVYLIYKDGHHVELVQLHQLT